MKYGVGDSDQRPSHDYFVWCERWFQAAARILKPGGSLYAMHYPEVCARWIPKLDDPLTFRALDYLDLPDEYWAPSAELDSQPAHDSLLHKG